MGILKANKWKIAAVLMLVAVSFSSYGVLADEEELCEDKCLVPDFYDNGQFEECVPKCDVGAKIGDCGKIVGCQNGTCIKKETQQKNGCAVCNSNFKWEPKDGGCKNSLVCEKVN